MEFAFEGGGVVVEALSGFVVEVIAGSLGHILFDKIIFKNYMILSKMNPHFPTPLFSHKPPLKPKICLQTLLNNKTAINKIKNSSHSLFTFLLLHYCKSYLFYLFLLRFFASAPRAAPSPQRFHLYCPSHSSKNDPLLFLSFCLPAYCCWKSEDYISKCGIESRVC